MPEETDYGPRDTNDEVEAQIREEKRQRAEEIAYAGYSTRATGVVARELKSAIADQRERDATIAELQAPHSTPTCGCSECITAHEIADKIRSMK